VFGAFSFVVYLETAFLAEMLSAVFAVLGRHLLLAFLAHDADVLHYLLGRCGNRRDGRIIWFLDCGGKGVGFVLPDEDVGVDAGQAEGVAAAVAFEID
jgi:hypothetical protein